ncbi:MAG: hypothetical protein RI885_2605 [Actinomycetota bacterium]
MAQRPTPAPSDASSGAAPIAPSTSAPGRRADSRVLHAEHIKVDAVSHGYGDRRVLVDIDLVVDPVDRVGLIGENGVGKSTLLRVIAGDEIADSGRVSRPRSTGFLRQELRLAPADTVGRLLDDAVAEQRDLIAELERAASGLGDSAETRPHRGRAHRVAADRYSRALEAAERADVWSIESRRDALLCGLGVVDIPVSRRLDEVSGGQRSRLALAALLLSAPDALLLDEPTNHLDDEAVVFLAAQLEAWRGPVLLASHDRAFLDEATTALVDIDPSPQGARRFGGARRQGSAGPFTDYLTVRAAERRRWEERFAAESEEAGRLDLVVAVSAREIAPGRERRDGDKMAYDFKAGTHQSQVARRVRNAAVRRDELERTRVEEPPARLGFTGIPSGSHVLADDEPLVTLAEVGVAGRLGPITLDLGARDRVLVTGGNGAGKSTLLGVLAGRLTPDGGAVRRRKGLRVAVLDQDVRFTDPTMTPHEIYGRAAGRARADAVPLSGLGLLPSRDLHRPVGELSVGQQRRVALASVMARPPHVFLLDEPTNHFSLGLVDELEVALGDYPGAVVIASHDRWLRSRWAGSTVPLGRTGGSPGNALLAP